MLDLSSYTTIASIFPRLVGAIYLMAFFPFLFQIKGLIGKKGILPASVYLKWAYSKIGKKAYRVLPTFFWFNCSDKALFIVVVLGVVSATLLLFGILCPITILCCFFLYLSIISVGQDFLSFGWEVFLQEIALNTFFLTLTDMPNLFIWISLNLLLFRFHLQAGAVKLQSKDSAWRDQTAIWYHYETQPIPNTTAWYVHKLPLWFHKLSCVLMFVAELIVPFFIFFTQEMRLVAFVGLVGLQFFIWLTGNFSYLNHMTVLFCAILLNNEALQLFGIMPPDIASTPVFLELGISAIGISFITLQLMNLWDHFFPNAFFRSLFSAVSSFHIVNRYGIFAVMTRPRYEITVEGSVDGKIWKEYHFYHKPTDCKKRPTRISPYQPRVDWQAWFLPFTGFHYELWVQNFLLKLLENEPVVTNLLRHNPFSDEGPKYIRAQKYLYEFTSFAEKRKSGAWWKRRYIGPYSPLLSYEALFNKSI